MEEASRLDGGLTGVNQVLYNLNRRGIEWDLCLVSSKRHTCNGLFANRAGNYVSKDSNNSRAPRRFPGTSCTAWLLHQENVVVIPKSSNPNRIRESCFARFSFDREVAELDRVFPPTARSQASRFKFQIYRPSPAPNGQETLS